MWDQFGEEDGSTEFKYQVGQSLISMTELGSERIMFSTFIYIEIMLCTISEKL